MSTYPLQQFGRAIAPFILGLMSVAITTVIVSVLGWRISTADAAMIHLLPVLPVAVWFGKWPAIATSLASALAWNFFFSRPFLELGIDDPRDLITLVVFVLIAVTVSYWSGKSGRLGTELTLQAEIAAKSVADERERARITAEAGKLQSALLASISHDFRNPLATIIGAASALRDGASGLTPGGRAALLATIEESGRQLNRFVVNLLDAGRLEAGALVLNRDWWEVDDLFGAVLDRVDAETCARVTLDVATRLPLLFLDFALMERVFANLLDNARKYSPPATPIAISAREKEARVVFEVTNALAGPAPDPARLFDRFYRADDRPDVQGTGLGLFICKGFVEAQDGTVAAHIDETTMTVTLGFPATETGHRFAAEVTDE